MKISVLGAGAMGSVLGGMLAKGGNEVTLIDVWEEAVQVINEKGLRIEDKTGNVETIRVRATSNPAEVGPVDLILVFVKCYHTEAAMRNAAPLIGPGTAVLSLQNGWGNGPRISAIVGQERLLLGVCYHSATVMGPGYVQHGGRGMTFMGELDGKMTDRLARIAESFNQAGIEVRATPAVLKEIWAKLSLNVCTLATSALLRFFAVELIQHDPLMELMRALLREAIAVANAQGIPLEFDERWEAITGLISRCGPGVKASMLQDVEKGRRTEIDVINGAISEAGRRLNIPTPYNDSMFWLVKSLEESLDRQAARSG
jgi:2-dehydropantoate 2-reductase